MSSTITSSSRPVLRFQEGSTVVPGDRLGTIRQKITSGLGTYVKGGHIYASLVGQLTLAEIENKTADREGGDNDTNNAFGSESMYTCSVIPTPTTTNGQGTLPATSKVLQIGQIVIGTVLRITPQNAIVDISVAEHVGVLSSQTPSNTNNYEGAIRMEDIRAGAPEQIQIGDCFRPGDLVVCRIISLGDARRYFLSTAETELGVLRATTSNGIAMIPISWKEVQCPITGNKEPRKCAKPITLQQ